MAVSASAAGAPAPVFAAIGHGALERVEDLSLAPGLSLEASPRQAAVLLVAGPLREDDRTPLRRLHDQMPHPRATAWWGSEPDPVFGAPTVIDGDPAGALADLHRRLVAGDHASEPDIFADAPPYPWRGAGDHGQGGEGMMGGKPYGRPMAMTDDDRRDGLALDAYAVRLGPFLPMLPPGLVLDVTLQGDVVQSAAAHLPPFDQGPGPAPLRAVARMARLLGLPALAERCLRAAAGAAPPPRRLRRRLLWSGALHAIPPGLGSVGGADARDRLADWADWAARADGGDAREPPAGRARLDDLLPGLEWSEAMIVINSFATAALRRMCAAPDDGEPA